MRYIKCYITNLFFQKISMHEHIYIAKAIFSRVNPRKYLPPFRIDSRTVGSDRNKMIPLGLETSQIFRGDSRRRRAPRVATRRDETTTRGARIAGTHIVRDVQRRRVPYLENGWTSMSIPCVCASSTSRIGGRQHAKMAVPNVNDFVDFSQRQ